jgi:hypothetical protein
MLRYFRELLAGRGFRYYLFWDGSPRAVGREYLERGLSKSLEIFPLKINSENQEASLSEALQKAGYAGDGLEVILYGPAVFQSVVKIDTGNSDISSWIYEHKNSILPSGISDDEMVWDYQACPSGESQLLFISLSKKTHIASREEYLGTLGYRITGITPLLGLALELYGPKIAGEGEDMEFPLQLPASITSFEPSDRGLVVITRPEETGLDGQDIPSQSFEGFELRRQVLESLSFQRSAQDFLSMAYFFSVRYFQKAVVALLILAALALAGNIFLNVKENQQREKLDELAFLEGSLGRLEGDIKTLGERQKVNALLESKRTKLGEYLNAIASAKPERVWWRKLDYKVGNGLSVEGFSVGEKEAASYYGELLKAAYLGGVQLGQIAKYSPPADSPIPSKFSGELFKFKLDVKGL